MDNTSNLILAISLFIIMYGMGLSLTLNDFRQIFIKPKAILTGLLNQLILLPLLAFAIISILPIQPEIAIGVIILAACPGGPTSNLISHLAKGDLALSVSLTAISSFVTLFSIPFIINLGLKVVLGQNTDIQLDVATTILQVFAIVIVPLVLGMITRKSSNTFADKMEKPVRLASAFVFVLVLVGIIAKEWSNIADYFAQAGLATLLLNLGTMGLGLLSARLLKLPIKQGISISIETGIQNGTLAISIATILLLNSSYAIAAAAYSLIMFATSIVVIFVGNKIGKKSLVPA